MWYLVAVVVGAGVLMWLAGRGDSPGEAVAVTDVSDQGLHIDDRVVPWASVFDVRLRTRRAWRSTWFGFDVRSEEAGALSVDGGGGLGERFLANTHHLPGFDHEATRRGLERSGSDVVCYNR